MKKVTIILNQMIIGGIEKAFFNLIEYIDRKQFEISVILIKHGGEFEKYLPKDIRVEYAEIPSLSNTIKQLKFAAFVKGIYYRFHIRKAKTHEEYNKYEYKLLNIPESINTDCLICFHHTVPLCILAASDSNAKKKIIWIHSELNERIKKEQYKSLLSKFDCICCVSYALKNEFDKLFPMFADKSTVIYNLVNEDEIRHLAEQEIPEKLQPVSLMTVARLSKVKGHLIIPAVTRELLDHGYKVNWYIVGGGSLENEIKAEIEKYNVNSFVHLLGAKTNPYPYMQKCDIYVQPSINEGFGLTVQEAKILHKPIVASNIPAFQEQIKTGVNGILTNLDPESMYKSIAGLIDDKILVENLTSNLSEYHFDIHNELEKIYHILT